MSMWKVKLKIRYHLECVWGGTLGVNLVKYGLDLCAGN